MIWALEAPNWLMNCSSLAREGSSSRSMKRLPKVAESWERSSDRAYCQLAGKLVMVIWRTMWRSHGAMFSPAAVAAFSTCSRRSDAT
jgi:hypothetical protein